MKDTTQMEETKMTMNSFEIKKKIVLAGDSCIFKDWAAHSTITMDEFVSALQWV